MSVLSEIDITALRALSGALRAGRLSMPLVDVALTPYLAPTQAPDVARFLAGLASNFTSAEALADVIDAVTDEREIQQARAPRVELVWSGPEAKDVTNRDTRVVVDEIFSQAKHSVLIAGYAVYQGKDIFAPLARRMDLDPALDVNMFLDISRRRGDTTRTSDLICEFANRFKTQQWPGLRLPKVFYDPRALGEAETERACLHAKCVVVDYSVALVSSANFTEAAQLRNIEVGALIRDQAYSTGLVEHFMSLVRSDILLPLCLL